MKTLPESESLERPSHTRIAAYRRTATRRPVQPQIDRLLGDVGHLQALMTGGDPAAARGAALTVAHAALVLAVTPAVEADDRRRRRETLRNVVVPVLDRAGLDHVAGLIAAALVHDGNPCAIARGVATPQ